MAYLIALFLVLQVVGGSSVTYCGPIVDSNSYPSQSPAYGDYGYPVGVELTIKCIDGFTQTGGGTAVNTTCISGGLWMPIPPLCSVVLCEQPQRENSNVQAQANSTGKIFTVTCWAGYHISGKRQSEKTEFVACRYDSGQTQVQVPTCSVNTCPVQNLGENVEISKSNRTYEYKDELSYWCRPGFRFTGSEVEGSSNRNAICLEHGNWSSILPCSNRTSCPLPNASEHFYADYGNAQGHVFQDSLTFRCMYGYHIQPTLLHGWRSEHTSTSTCQANGSWIPPSPLCSLMTCRLPNANERSYGQFVNINGSKNISASEVPLGTAVNFSCLEGYNISGMRSNSVVTKCGEYGNWTQNMNWSTFKCQQVTCVLQFEATTNIFKRANVKHNGHSFGPINGLPNLSLPYKSILNITCTEGYHVKTKPQTDRVSVSTCKKDGNWSTLNPIPVCKKVKCVKRNSTVHAVREYYPQAEKYNFARLRGHVNYTCDYGYHVSSREISEQTITSYCLINGSWSIPEPNCTATKCPPITTSSHEGLNETHYPNSRSYNYASKNGSVAYTCQFGYEFSGEDAGNSALVSQCGVDGKWSKNNVSCKRVSCGVPNIPNSSFTNPSEAKYGDTLTVTCQSGYHWFTANSTVREGIIRCLATAKWSNGSCVDVECQERSSIPHAAQEYHPLSIGNNTLYNLAPHSGHVTYVCDYGYHVSARSFLEQKITSYCLINGSWSTAEPACNATKCPRIRGNHDSSSIAYYPNATSHHYATWNGSVTYTCLIGYEFSAKNAGNSSVVSAKNAGNSSVVSAKNAGNSSVVSQCREDGTWSQENVTCQPVSCGVPNISNSNLITLRKAKYRDNLTVTCQPGYYWFNANSTVRQGMITCQASAQWSNGSCLPVTCLDISLVNAVNTSTGPLDYPNSLRVACEEGFAFSDHLPVSLDSNNILNVTGELSCQANGSWSSGMCTDVDECSQLQDVTCHADSECINIPGAYRCMCKEEFVGDGSLTCNPKLDIGSSETVDVIVFEKSSASEAWTRTAFYGNANRSTNISQNAENQTLAFLVQPSDRSSGDSHDIEQRVYFQNIEDSATEWVSDVMLSTSNAITFDVSHTGARMALRTHPWPDGSMNKSELTAHVQYRPFRVGCYSTPSSTMNCSWSESSLTDSVAAVNIAPNMAYEYRFFLEQSNASSTTDNKSDVNGVVTLYGYGYTLPIALVARFATVDVVDVDDGAKDATSDGSLLAYIGAGLGGILFLCLLIILVLCFRSLGGHKRLSFTLPTTVEMSVFQRIGRRHQQDTQKEDTATSPDLHDVPGADNSRAMDEPGPVDLYDVPARVSPCAVGGPGPYNSTTASFSAAETRIQIVSVSVDENTPAGPHTGTLQGDGDDEEGVYDALQRAPRQQTTTEPCDDSDDEAYEHLSRDQIRAYQNRQIATEYASLRLVHSAISDDQWNATRATIPERDADAPVAATADVKVAYSNVELGRKGGRSSIDEDRNATAAESNIYANAPAVYCGPGMGNPEGANNQADDEKRGILAGNPDANTSAPTRISLSAVEILTTVTTGSRTAWFAGNWKQENGGLSLEVSVKKLMTSSDDQARKALLEEADRIGQFFHRNVLDLYGVVCERNEVLLVLEPLKGTLLDHLATMDTNDPSCPDRLIMFAKDIATGMKHIADQNVVHGNLSAAVIYLGPSCACKIGGFDTAAKNEQLDTSLLIAPEVLAGRDSTSASDVWSFAFVLTEIFTMGAQPSLDALSRKLRADYRPEKPDICPTALYGMQERCWSDAPSRRPTFNDITTALWPM